MRASADQVVEALVLACEHSKMGLRGDTVRVAVNAFRSSIVRENAIVLQPFWDLMQDEGADETAVTEALCRFKTWEERMAAPVLLPANLGDLTLEELAAKARSVLVGESKVDAVLGATLGIERPARPDPTVEFVYAVPEESGDASGGWRNARYTLPIAVAVSVLTLLFVSWQVWSMVGGPAFEELSNDTVAKYIPVSQAKRLGSQVNVTLADAGWNARSKAEKTRDLRSALATLRPDGVTGLLIMDAQNQLQASIAVDDTGKEQLFVAKGNAPPPK